ncbi:MAG: isoprenoid biosynthesis glyoxalase ElbB [Anaeromyxobacteraceae bacterium]
MTSRKRVGVILAGSGYLDGAEIQEATLTLLFLDRRGAEVTAMAPDVAQMHVVDHLKGEPAAEQRNVLAEAARITRGNIQDVRNVKAADLDALILPGGYGAAKNLCTFATEGVKLQVNPDVERLVRDMASAGKPLGFVCISPVIAAKVLGAKKVKLTIGNDPATAAAVNALGAVHVDSPVDQIVVDERNKVVSTPAYMLGPTIAPVAAGIEKLVGAVLEMA